MSFGYSVSQLGHAEVCTCLLGGFLASQSLENVQLPIPVCLEPSDFSLILSTAAVHLKVTCHRMGRLSYSKHRAGRALPLYVALTMG